MTAHDLEEVFATFDSPEDLFAWVRSSDEATSVFYERLLPLLIEPDERFLSLNEGPSAPLIAGHQAEASAHSAGGASLGHLRGVRATITAEGRRGEFPCPRRPTGQARAEPARSVVSLSERLPWRSLTVALRESPAVQGGDEALS